MGQKMKHDNDNEHLPKRQKDARALGTTKYFTGKPCKHGHTAPRYTINAACVTCTYVSKQRRKNRDPELWKEITREERRRAFERDPERPRKHTREWMRRWREENPEESRERQAQWRRDNPERAKEHDANNSARRRSADGKFTAKDVANLFTLQRGKCAECNKSLKMTGYHVDHVVPIARGGTNWPDNLQLLCPPCNQSKHAKDPIEWARMKGRLL